MWFIYIDFDVIVIHWLFVDVVSKTVLIDDVLVTLVVVEKQETCKKPKMVVKYSVCGVSEYSLNDLSGAFIFTPCIREI